ncbi:TorF family putative porin [Novosphingobium resinovorum]|uniref:TorF family putative porin n=1 Tax=Novosphingobium resinovorum TaxID=158500 RepID=UPI002ED4E0E9|nr:TorF family putative porin [Novosphingobium resinovorum]
MLLSVRGAIAATLLAGTAISAAPAFAQDAEAPKEITITGSAALTSDYRFRGVSQSGGDIAIQGGITASHASGFYVGTWSSSLDNGSLYGSTEVDLFGGWTGQVSSGLTLDAGLLYYAYPNGTGGASEFFEPYASISGQVGPAKLKVGGNYAWKQKALPSYTSSKDDNIYLYSNVDIAIPNTPLTVSGHIGYTDGVLSPCYYCDPVVAGDKTNWDWSIGASATVYGPLSVSLSYVGVTGPSVDSYTDDTVVATLTASF